MTLVNDTVVVIIGGMTSSSQYSDAVYILDISADEIFWTDLGNTSIARPIGELV